jgi:hypothetical protein
MLFLSSSLAASLCVYLWARPGRKELLLTGGVAAGLCAWFGLTGAWYAKIMVAAMYWAVVAFVVSFVVGMRKGGKARVKVLEGMTLVPVLTLGTLPMLFLMSWLTPVTWDYYLYAASSSFGMTPPDFLVAQFVMGQYWLKSLCEFTYMNLPVGLTVVFLMLREKAPEMADKLFRCGLLLAFLGWGCYLLFPASGSVATFKDLYPYDAPPLSQVAVEQRLDIGNARNCLPSLHTSWVLALYWFTRPLGRLVRGVALGFTILTLIYVLVCGHYVMDIFGTLPWVTAIYAWCLRGAGWQRVAFEGVGLYLACLAYLRYGGPLYLSSPVYSWSVVALSVGWTVWRVRGLHREAAELRFSTTEYATVA